MTAAKLVVINGDVAFAVPQPGMRKLSHAEHYLQRQVKAARSLGLPVLERYYLTGFLALQLWLMEEIETCPEDSHA